MMSTLALWRALVRRLAAWQILAIAALTGVASGYIAHIGFTTGTDVGTQLTAWGLFTGFPRAALYATAFVSCWRTCGDVARDSANAWTHQYLAGGGTRDRYILALTGANATTALMFYVVAVTGWTACVGFGGQGAAAADAVLRILPAGVLYLCAACALGAAAVSLTASASGAQTVVIVLYVLPWILVMLNKNGEESAPPLYFPLLRLIPPFGLHLDVRHLLSLSVYTTAALGLAWLLSFRLLRVR